MKLILFACTMLFILQNWMVQTQSPYCTYINAEANVLKRVADCYRANVQSRIVNIALNCATQSHGRTITLEEYLNKFCTNDDELMDKARKCFEKNAPPSEFENISASFERSEECANVVVKPYRDRARNNGD